MIKEIFSKFLSPEVVDRAAHEQPVNQLDSGSADYIFVAVAGTSPNVTGKNLGVVAEIADNSSWMVQGFLCNVVVLVRGTIPGIEKSGPTGRNLADILAKALSNDVKSVYGEESAHFGLMGNQTRMTYGVLFPSFPAIMSKLMQMPFGTSHENRA